MNEWDEIKEMFTHRVKTPICQFLLTMVATVVFDLTVAIIVGVLLAMVLFVLNNTQLSIDMSEVAVDRIDHLNHHHKGTRVIYLAGPLFFGNQGQLKKQIEEIVGDSQAIVLSMRGVPSIDDSGIHEIKEVVQLCKEHNTILYLSGLQKNVRTQFERVHFIEEFSDNHIFWDAVAAIRNLDDVLQGA